jgi:hypothetical protein
MINNNIYQTNPPQMNNHQATLPLNRVFTFSNQSIKYEYYCIHIKSYCVESINYLGENLLEQFKDNY